MSDIKFMPQVAGKISTGTIGKIREVINCSEGCPGVISGGGWIIGGGNLQRILPRPSIDTGATTSVGFGIPVVSPESDASDRLQATQSNSCNRRWSIRIATATNPTIGIAIDAIIEITRNVETDP